MDMKVDFGDDGVITVDVCEILSKLGPEAKQRVLELYVFDEIVEAIERQLKHQTDLDGWDTSGWRDGSKMREAILKFQGLEPEFKKDLESKIQALECTVVHYEKYYNWYWKVFHLQTHSGEGRIIDRLHSAVGRPESK